MLLQRRRFRKMQATLTARERPVARMRLQVAHDLLLTRKPIVAIPAASLPKAVVVRAPTTDVRRSEVFREGVAGREGFATSLPVTYM